MKAYFLIAKDVGDLTAIVCAELEARQAKRRPMLDRMLRPLSPPPRRRARRSTISSSTTTASTCCDEDAFERDPVNLIRLFWLADRHNLPVHPDATRLATRSLSLIGPTLRNDPEANRLFLDILTSRQRARGGAAADERGRRARPLHPGFRPHRRDDAVQHVSSLHGRRASHPLDRRARRHRGRAPRRPSIRSPDQISGPSATGARSIVALFLHDIAKGRPEDHSHAGAAHRPQARPAARPRRRRDRDGRLARRAPSPDVERRRRAATCRIRRRSRLRRRWCRRWSG